MKQLAAYLMESAEDAYKMAEEKYGSIIAQHQIVATLVSVFAKPVDIIVQKGPVQLWRDLRIKRIIKKLMKEPAVGEFMKHIDEKSDAQKRYFLKKMLNPRDYKYLAEIKKRL